MSNKPNKLLVEYLDEDRQWKRQHRIAYAYLMRRLFPLGIYFRLDKRYDVAFWNNVLLANGAQL